ncbi:MAG TPA: cell division protein FtsA, partial [bacterium]|nr:cell division protein FtsA [bacterium]
DVIAADQTGRQILHLLPQQYFVDYQSPTRKAPLGLHAHTLEVRVNAITAAVNPIQDIMQCLKRLDIEVELIFPGAWAAAEAVLNEEEKKLGALVIDLGRGTTNIAVYRDNNLVLTNSFRVGGGHVDSDLCMLLHLPANYAEELKKNHGYCNYDTLAAEKNPVLNEELDVFTPAGRLNRKVTVADLSKIVTERTQDILGKIVRESLVSTRLLPRLSGGVVLTGGSARLKGIVRLAEQIFGLPARIGVPRSRPGLDRSLATPAFSAGIGLLLLAEKDLRREEPESWWERLWRRLSRRR